MKTFPLFLSYLFMLTSWAMGLYFLTVFYTPTIIIPVFSEFIWMQDYKGLLGLTALFLLVTIPLVGYMFKHRHHFIKKKTWYSVALFTHVFWIGTMALQLKTFTFNLGICH